MQQKRQRYKRKQDEVRKYTDTSRVSDALELEGMGPVGQDQGVVSDLIHHRTCIALGVRGEERGVADLAELRGLQEKRGKGQRNKETRRHRDEVERQEDQRVNRVRCPRTTKPGREACTVTRFALFLHKRGQRHSQTSALIVQRGPASACFAWFPASARAAYS